MKTSLISSLLLLPLSLCAQKATIYKKGWIDFNKNGKMDVYENPDAQIEDRISDTVIADDLGRKNLPDGHPLRFRQGAERCPAHG